MDESDESDGTRTTTGGGEAIRGHPAYTKGQDAGMTISRRRDVFEGRRTKRRGAEDGNEGEKRERS